MDFMTLQVVEDVPASRCQLWCQFSASSASMQSQKKASENSLSSARVSFYRVLANSFVPMANFNIQFWGIARVDEFFDQANWKPRLMEQQSRHSQMTVLHVGSTVWFASHCNAEGCADAAAA